MPTTSPVDTAGIWSILRDHDFHRYQMKSGIRIQLQQASVAQIGTQSQIGKKTAADWVRSFIYFRRTFLVTCWHIYTYVNHLRFWRFLGRLFELCCRICRDPQSMQSMQVIWSITCGSCAEDNRIHRYLRLRKGSSRFASCWFGADAGQSLHPDGSRMPGRKGTLKGCDVGGLYDIIWHYMTLWWLAYVLHFL